MISEQLQLPGLTNMESIPQILPLFQQAFPVNLLRGLGNAVVPYQAYQIFEAIAEFERDYKNQRLE